MNYEQAREIGPNGPAPGKWNWSNLNDSIRSDPYTAAPCAYPDSPIPDDWKFGDPDPRYGRARCDHDTREEAERHHWRYELGRVKLLPRLDLATLRQRSRCDVPDCQNWEDFRTQWPGGLQTDSLCEQHATHEAVVALHPFVDGITEIHS